MWKSPAEISFYNFLRFILSRNIKRTLFHVVNVSEISIQVKHIFRINRMAQWHQHSLGSLSTHPAQSRDLDNLCWSRLYRVNADRCFRFIFNVIRGKRTAAMSSTSLNLMWNEAVKFPLNLFFSIIFWHLRTLLHSPKYMHTQVRDSCPFYTHAHAHTEWREKSAHIPNSGSR